MNQDNREKWLKKALKKVPKGTKIIDAGAGQLKYKKFCRHLNYVAQDFAQYDGVGDGKGLQTGKYDNSMLDIVSDIIDIPVADSSFGAVMCIEVLEHIPYPHLAIKEFSRILKKNGLLILTAPFNSLTHFAPYHFSTGLSRYWYEKVLGDYGFSIMDLKLNGNYFEYLAQELGRLPSVCQDYCSIVPSDQQLINTLSESLGKEMLKASTLDSGSKELLCFGIHILARKDS